MNDINFFESYVGKKQFKIGGKRVYCFIAILMVLFVGLSTIINQIRIARATKDIARFKAILEDDSLIARRDEIERKQLEINEYKEYLGKLKKIDTIVEENSKIDDRMLDDITSKVPKDLFLKSMSLYMDKLELIGVSDNKWSIAEFGTALETIKGFKEVFISSISREEFFYKFIVNVNLKEMGRGGEDEPFERD